MFGQVRVRMLDLTPVHLMADGDLAFEVGLQICEVEPALPGFARDRQHLHVSSKAEDGAWCVSAAMSGNR